MIVWPALLTPRSIKFTIDARSRSGGVSVVGTEQIVASSGGVWRATLGAIPVMTREKRNLWRAIEAQAQGRVNEFLVPVFSIDQHFSADGITHSDDSYFSDDGGYEQSTIVATFAESAALRATQITLTVPSGDIEPGQYFSVGEGRLYRVASLVESDGDDRTISIWPPLREAVAAEAEADFASPKCRMRLASDDAMAAEFDLGRFATPTVDFIEAL